MLFESVSEGFLAFWKSKIPKFSPAAILTYKNTPLKKFLFLIRGGYSYKGGYSYVEYP